MVPLKPRSIAAPNSTDTNAPIHENDFSIIQYSNSFIIDLYHRHSDKLKSIRANMIERYHANWQPQFDDTEAEITCLLLFHFKPKKVVEFSPCAGWSSAIILDALAINGNAAHLTSFDIVDDCLSNLQQNHSWEFIQGDVRHAFQHWNLSTVDYLFIDSDHSREFATHYVESLLKPLLESCRKENKKLPVSVHDVFHQVLASEEGEVVIDFLTKHDIPYYTASWTKDNYYDLVKTKQALGLDKVIHHSWGRSALETQANSAIFFILS